MCTSARLFRLRSTHCLGDSSILTPIHVIFMKGDWKHATLNDIPSSNRNRSPRLPLVYLSRLGQCFSQSLRQMTNQQSGTSHSYQHSYAISLILDLMISFIFFLIYYKLTSQCPLKVRVKRFIGIARIYLHLLLKDEIFTSAIHFVSHRSQIAEKITNWRMTFTAPYYIIL